MMTSFIMTIMYKDTIKYIFFWGGMFIFLLLILSSLHFLVVHFIFVIMMQILIMTLTHFFIIKFLWLNINFDELYVHYFLCTV